MGNYVLTLTQYRCPDGAELEPNPTQKNVGGGNWGRRIRFRSTRLEPYRRRLETPDDLIVTKFLNAAPVTQKDGSVDYEAIVEFVSEYGCLGGLRPAETEIFGVTASEHRISESLGNLLDKQRWFSTIWDCYGAGQVKDAVDIFRNHMSSPVEMDVAMTPDITFRSGKPTLTLPSISLTTFMVMETALVITGGSQVMRCSECGTIFVTGSGTGRRNTSRYCSNRCRVAAQRSGKATSASPVEDVMTDEEKLQNIAAAVRGGVKQ